jgi:hypothetical protein
VCELAKKKRRAKKAKTTTNNLERDGALKAVHLSPGLRVSVDYFECSQRGRICDSYKSSMLGDAFLVTMLHHMGMWNMNLDFQQWKQSEQSNPMKYFVWKM